MKIYTEESKDMIKAGIIGSTGYAGGELASCCCREMT